MHEHITNEINKLAEGQLICLLKAESIRTHLVSMGPIESPECLETMLIGHNEMKTLWLKHKNCQAGIDALERLKSNLP